MEKPGKRANHTNIHRRSRRKTHPGFRPHLCEQGDPHTQLRAESCCSQGCRDTAAAGQGPRNPAACKPYSQQRKQPAPKNGSANFSSVFSGQSSNYHTRTDRCLRPPCRQRSCGHRTSSTLAAVLPGAGPFTLEGTSAGLQPNLHLQAGSARITPGFIQTGGMLHPFA